MTIVCPKPFPRDKIHEARGNVEPAIAIEVGHCHTLASERTVNLLFFETDISVRPG